MNITEIHDSDYEEMLRNNKKVLLDCYAPWCSSCKLFYPVFERLSDEPSDIKFCKTNIDDNPELSERFDIMSIPTVLAFENGQLKNKSIGLTTKEQLKKLL